MNNYYTYWMGCALNLQVSAQYGGNSPDICKLDPINKFPKGIFTEFDLLT